MNKVVLLVVGLLLLGLRFALGQSIGPRVEWQKSYGGGLNDILYSVQQTADGGYILGGRSTSTPSGNKTAPHYGNYDYWVIRVDANGNVVWEKSFGGSNWDELFRVEQTPDGGFIVAGSTDSVAGGNKTSETFGYRDGWIIKLDANGSKLWERAFGGSSSDVIWSLAVTSDGGFIIGGYSLSPISGNKSSTLRGGDDYWVLRLGPDGGKIWEQTYGGFSDDRLYAVRQTSDGGFILGGYSNSGVGGTKTTANFGGLDFWLVRTDAAGTQLWDRSFGGGSSDEMYGVVQTSDGGYFMGGYSLSGPSGNKTSLAYGGYDYWVVRADAAGNKLWDDSYGGYGNEGFLGTFGVVQTGEGGYFFGSGTQGYTAGGNKLSVEQGGGDWWLVRLNSAGVRVWDYSFGSSFFDAMYSLQQTRDGGYIMGGSSYGSNDGNKTAVSNGGADFWLVKLFPDVIKPRLTALPPHNFQDGHFRFLLSGQSNSSYVTEYSVNFTNWVSLQTNQLLVSPAEISVPVGLSGFQRYYRVKLQP